MATGLEVLGAVSASLEIVKVAKACLSVFNSVRDISLASGEQTDAHFSLVVQGIKFERWCSSVGIQDVIRVQDSQHPKEKRRAEEMVILKDVLMPQLRLKNDDVRTLTQSALEGMRKKFDDAFNILSRYSREMDEPVPKEESAKSSTKWNKMWKGSRGSSTAKVKHPGPSGAAPRPTGLSAVSSTARWAMSDKKAVTELLSSIDAINKLLLELVQPSLQTQIGRRTDMTILDHVDQSAASSITYSFPEDNDIRALARIRKWQIREERENQDEDQSLSLSLASTKDEYSGRQVQPYQVQDFPRGTLRLGEYRSLSELDGKRVMVEWKYYNNDHPVRMEQTLRLGALVGLLNRNDLFRRFATLPCRGLVNDTGNSRIGIVFAGGETDHGTMKMKTLFDTIRDETVPPPIGWRFDLASRLVTALHHLHSVHWFHKSIRSDNIVSFPATTTTTSTSSPRDGLSRLASEKRMSISKPPDMRTDAAEEPSNGDTATPALRQPPPAPAPFYLVGWDLSRPNHPSELSETLSVSTSGYQSKKDAIEMYSHPATHQRTGTGTTTKKRQRYRAEFDIYSMGLVLLEIGLWRTIDTMRARCRDDSTFRSRVCTEYCDRLLSTMGVVYWRVVQRCLNNAFGLDDQAAGPDTDGFLLQVAFEKHVVTELEKCFA